MSKKKIVRYTSILGRIVVGKPAVVFPVDHTGELVSNTTFATTSNVVKYDETTETFETENSVYVPA